MLAAFNKSQMVAYRSSLDKSFSNDNIVEVYDLKSDPKQRKNLVNKIDYFEYTKLIDAVNKRFNELKKCFG